jgi:tetratricopeptide (TPR) repeat protein
MYFARIFKLSALLLPALLAPPGASAQQGGDLQAQILYAYQTEDGNALTNLVQDLATRLKADADDAALRYHLAHAQYRWGLLAGAANGHGAETAFADCIDVLKPLISPDVKSVEPMVLQSACYSRLADHRKLEAVLLRSRAEERLKSALALSPRNPRAMLIASEEGRRQAKPGSAELQQAFAKLELAAKLFDESSATGVDAPGWGHAEAYLALGRELQQRGDQLGARNWIEKSLIVAPDYKAAQRQLALLVHGG